MIFIVLKSDVLSLWFSGLIRTNRAENPELASVLDLGWLGFSYLAFRLIHTLRDHQTGQLPALTLREYMAYVIFFPAYTAGPIDRAERFIIDLPKPASAQLDSGGMRIVIGLFKKFVLADSLALIALNATNAQQAASAGGLWVLLYAYSLRLFFDFSGYSDIAIGHGHALRRSTAGEF